MKSFKVMVYQLGLMMLRPFDCLEVDALLHHLPQGAHVTQSVDMLKGRRGGGVYKEG